MVKTGVLPTFLTDFPTETEPAGGTSHSSSNSGTYMLQYMMVWPCTVFSQLNDCTVLISVVVSELGVHLLVALLCLPFALIPTELPWWLSD